MLLKWIGMAPTISHQYSFNFLFGTFQSLYKQNKSTSWGLTGYVWILKSSHFPMCQPKQHLFQEILCIFTRHTYTFSTPQNLYIIYILKIHSVQKGSNLGKSKNASKSQQCGKKNGAIIYNSSIDYDTHFQIGYALNNFQLYEHKCQHMMLRLQADMHLM